MNVSAHSLETPAIQPLQHPWPTGYIFESPGAHLTYRIVGPCCRLYDREQLPWPCCRIQWHSKEPSWRRVGKRFTVDLATRKHPSYCIEIVGQSYRSEPIVMTLYTVKLSAELQNWWHTKRLKPQPANTSSKPSDTKTPTVQTRKLAVGA
ncbi:MAG: hypothetical protein AAFY72_09405 [Cyanobacteria bacterium J06649_4]